MIALPLLFLLAQAATAPAPAPAAVRPAAPARAAPSPGPFPVLRQRGFSNAGVQILSQAQAKRRADDQRIRAEMQTIEQQLPALAGGATVDAARLGAALRRHDSLRAQLNALQTEIMIEALASLSTPDRLIFARAFGVLPPAGAPPAAARK